MIKGMFSQPDSTYGPSLLIDMEDGRATEAEHTIGDLLARAQRRGVSADPDRRAVQSAGL
jgi:ketopantoate reductase